ncbi:hypothetical protein Tco_0527237 [Tanacetum coccineum]
MKNSMLLKLDANNAKDPHYTKDCPLKEEAKPSKKLTTRNLVDLFKEEDIEQQLRDSIKGITQILPSTDAAIRNQRASIKTLKIQITQMIKVLQERGFGSLSSSTEVNLRDQVKSISTTIDADSYPIRRASVSVMPLSTYLNLRLGELAHTKLTVELADRKVKYPKGIAKNMLVGEVIEEFRTRDDELDAGIDDYPSYCNYDKKIHIDYFTVLENMDAYRDEGMGDIIFGKPFLREVGIKARRFEGMITIYNGNESVTYQIVRSHLRFKHHTNEKCNKIPPLLKVSDEDKNNGISHPYQKLKGFYKGVLNLGPAYIQDVKTKE